MGYACPVCETPQADGRHLANHLAFTAMIHGDDHEAWLAEHAPEWEEAGERDLAERVVENATEIGFPPSGESATECGEPSASHGHGDRDHDHDGDTGDGHAHPHGHGGGRERERGPTDVTTDPDIDIEDASGGGSETGTGDERDVAAVVTEARELTRRMYDGTDSAGADGLDSSDDPEDRSDSDRERTDGDADDGPRSDGQRG